VVEVSLEPGFSVADPAALGEYLLHVAWSAETKEANWAVRVQVLSDPQVSMVDAVDAAGWKSKSGNQKRPERASVRAAEVKERSVAGRARCLSCRKDSSSARRRSLRRDPRMSAACRGLASRARLSVGVVGLVVILSGCALGGSDGQSKESADAALLAIPGVSEASVNTSSLRSGFQVETSTTVEVTLEIGFVAPDPAALVDYLSRVAWSTQTKEANTSVLVQVVSEPQISILDTLDAGGWESAGGRSQHPERALVSAGEVKERFGDWPGDVPELPDGLRTGPTSAPAP